MQKERAAISRNAATHLEPRFKPRQRAPEPKDFDDHSVHQRGNVQRGEPRPAPREECAEDDPGDVGRVKRQNTRRHRSVPSRRHAHNPLEAKPRSLLRTSNVKGRSESPQSPVFWRPLGPALRAKRLDGIPCRLRPNSLSPMSAIYFSLSPSIISEASKPRTLKLSAYPKYQPNVALRVLLLCARARLFATDDKLTQPLHELTQSQDRAHQAGSNDHFWKQLCVSLGKTGAPRPHVPSSAKEMSC